jgi:2-C-methyl-D-erythritol 4-phosphate cytidylyltransferase/2-C-methyl-D-erythritol 2,4-cyclodiphosphate synthase
MSNLKITRAGDIATAETFLAARLGDIRTGTGFDVHRFAPGDHVTICGVHVPHSHALEGHSDADVGLHAMTDAILGCIGNGDIGSHFSPADPRWKGADSAQFLQHAIGLVAERGGIVAHLDVTIICERPKIGPHRAAMVAQVAKISGLRADQISVKATTTEGLGFTGRNEGIAAQAVATVRLPFV